METFKNFIVGCVALVVSLMIFGIIMLTWPVLVGISSFILTIAAAILFLVLIFYVIVLLGYIVREVIKKK